MMGDPRALCWITSSTLSSIRAMGLAVMSDEPGGPTHPVATRAGRSGDEIWTLPNLLTLGRLVLGCVVFALVAWGQFRWALGLFVIAALSDALDGYLARALGQTSALGRQLDPLVDKVIVIGTLTFLLPLPNTGLAPWMVVAILVRELGVQTLRSLVEGQGIAFGAKASGKFKMLMQCLAIAAILATQGLEPSTAVYLLRDAFIWIAVGLTLYSGLAYLAAAWPLLTNSTNP